MNSNKRTITLLLAMGLCLIPSSALAAGPAAAPTPAPAAAAPPVLVGAALVQPAAPAHKFLDGKNAFMLGLSAALMAVDIATTKQAPQVPGSRGMNPPAHSSGAIYALKFASIGAEVGITYAMHKTGHYKAERIVPMIFDFPSLISTVHNAGIHR